MTNHSTATKTLVATNPETGETKEITVSYPVGSLDEPTAFGKLTMETLYNPEGWKLGTLPFFSTSQEEIDEVVYALDWYVGGHETGWTADGRTVVWSRGYYHHIGA